MVNIRMKISFVVAVADTGYILCSFYQNFVDGGKERRSRSISLYRLTRSFTLTLPRVSTSDVALTHLHAAQLSRIFFDVVPLLYEWTKSSFSIREFCLISADVKVIIRIVDATRSRGSHPDVTVSRLYSVFRLAEEEKVVRSAVVPFHVE